MKEIAIINEAENQLIELEQAVSAGNYSALSQLLLQQALSLHLVGNEFLQKAEKYEKLYAKKAYLDVAFRAYGQSLKSMRAVRELSK
ncbi:hypothetical protein DGMP_01590 [Desulfomarina profundi]|uniref:Uncharacterized protein n=1 Tax=Desulfomarina profundi TaxID=2772557 RepID=A0A8D5JPZ0_9BACT|nr:hypothetical protein [Desulfomarina profundi]BCL59466.1 hypothetical protein DGMP_01590 [Desulfomarina profundi]